MYAIRVPVLIITAALALLLSGVAPAAAAPVAFRILQVNMCMTGSPHYVRDNVKNGRSGAVTCFPNGYVSKDEHGKIHYKTGYTAREKTIAEEKRLGLITQITANAPSAVTINEACTGDLATIVSTLRTAGLPYSYSSAAVGGEGKWPLPCSVGRGYAVNAIISSNGFVAGSKRYAYFEHGGARSWLCARVKSGVQLSSRGVRVCTTHLSGPSSHWGGHAHQPVECAAMRAVLKRTGTATVFGGDTNMNAPKKNCAPAKWWGLQDTELVNGLRNPLTGLQHVYYTPDLTRGPTCGSVHKVLTTDHKAFLVTLLAAPTRTQGLPCAYRDVRK